MNLSQEHTTSRAFWKAAVVGRWSQLAGLVTSEHRNNFSLFQQSSLPIYNIPNLTSEMPATTSETFDLVTRTVSVAPLVLLSVADHYGRSVQGSKKRVVGVLLGQNDSKGIRVSNSFGGQQSFASKDN
jgi:hypothetical protein